MFTDCAIPYLCYILAVLSLLCAAACHWSASFGGRSAWIAAFSFAGMTRAELAVSSLADVVEATRHHFVFTAMSDMALLFALALFLTPAKR